MIFSFILTVSFEKQKFLIFMKFIFSILSLWIVLLYPIQEIFA